MYEVQVGMDLHELKHTALQALVLKDQTSVSEDSQGEVGLVTA